MTDLVMSLLDPSNSGEACKRLVLDAADKIAELQARLAECERERDEAQEYISVCDDSFIEVCNERDTLRAQLAALREACSELIVDGCSYGDDCTPEAMRKHYKCWTCQLRDALGR